MAGDEGECYGKMFPTVIGRPDNLTVAGEVFSYYIKHLGPMVTDRSVSVDHEAAAMPRMRGARILLLPLRRQALAGDRAVCLSGLRQGFAGAIASGLTRVGNQRDAQMSSKPVIKVALLVFVLGSLVILAVKESRRWTAPDPVAAQEGSAAAAAVPRPQSDRVIAYYFHTTYRCATCRRIEAYSREAIDAGFARELKDGSLEFRLVNVQLPENRHFIEDYQLFTKSLVLVHMKGGKQVEWTNLDRVWELTGNRVAFVGYVQQGVRGYLEKQ